MAYQSFARSRIGERFQIAHGQSRPFLQQFATLIGQRTLSAGQHRQSSSKLGANLAESHQPALFRQNTEPFDMIEIPPEAVGDNGGIADGIRITERL